MKHLCHNSLAFVCVFFDYIVSHNWVNNGSSLRSALPPPSFAVPPSATNFILRFCFAVILVLLLRHCRGHRPLTSQVARITPKNCVTKTIYFAVEVDV